MGDEGGRGRRGRERQMEGGSTTVHLLEASIRDEAARGAIHGARVPAAAADALAARFAHVVLAEHALAQHTHSDTERGRERRTERRSPQM